MTASDKLFDLQLFADGTTGNRPAGQNPPDANSPGGGVQAGGGGTGDQPGKTFTQEDVDRIVQERLAREREKYKDYPELKKAAEEYQKLKEAQMSETEKLQAKLAEYERKITDYEYQIADAKLELAKQTILEELGLPKAWANRLKGMTEEEIRKDAEELKKLLGAAGKAVGSGTNPPTKTDINPWKKETFNLTMQAKILKENPALAARLKAEAGLPI